MKKLMLVLMIGLFTAGFYSTPMGFAQDKKIEASVVTVKIDVKEKEHWKCRCKEGRCSAAPWLTTKPICYKATREFPDCSAGKSNC
jgi:hypothetical protein